MPAGIPLSGIHAVVRINGGVLYQSEYDVEPETHWDETLNAEGNGFMTKVACYRMCRVRIRGWWDGGANIHDGPLNIQDGSQLSNVRIYINTVGGPYWYFPIFNVVGVPMQVRTGEKIMYTLNGEAQGDFFYPSGAAA